jgi:hypothetical protein
MTADVQSLGPGEIDRSAAGAQPQQGSGHVEAPAAEGASESQTAAVAHLAELRKQAADPALDRGKRDALMQKMSELSRHAFLGERSPSWYGEQTPDPRLSDNSEYDEMSGALDGLAKPMTADEKSQFKFAGTVKGLHPAVNGEVSKFVEALAMPSVIANQILDRAVKHYGADFDGPALTKIEPLSAAEQADFYETGARIHPGGAPAFAKLAADVREALGPEIVAELDRRGLTKTSLAYDARVLNALLFWGRTRPARA